MEGAHREEPAFMVRHQRPARPTESQFPPYRNTWLGPYATETEARAAIEESRSQPEFCGEPDGFTLTQLLYVLRHTHEFGDERETAETKELGIYTTEAQAKAAIAHYRELPGFRDAPDGFYFEPNHLNMRYWDGGFSTISYDEDETASDTPKSLDAQKSDKADNRTE